MMKTLRVGLCQMAATKHKEENIKKALSYILEAKTKGAELVVLPECFNCPYGTKYFKDYAEPIPPILSLCSNIDEEKFVTASAISKIAQEQKLWIVAGSIPESDAVGKVYNSSMIFDTQGTLQNVTRKVHLFKIDTEKVKVDESEVLTAGNNAKPVVVTTTTKTTKSGNEKEGEEGLSATMGVGICFDVRYPQLAMHFAQHGTSFLVYPGAFNMVTGPAHWQLAARSRAVDTQQFVILCSCARDEKADYIAWGHSLVVNPWGEVIVEADEKEQIIMADLDFSKIEECRKSVPILAGTRHDLYQLMWNAPGSPM